MNSVTHLNTKFKDEDGGGDSPKAVDFHAEVVHNGFILHTTYDDGSEVKQVFTDFDEMVKDMKIDI